MSEAVIVALIMAGLPLLGAFLTWAYRKGEHWFSSRRKERKAAKELAGAATAAVNNLERENEEQQLVIEELEAEKRELLEGYKRITLSLHSLAESYRRLADGRAVKS